MKRSDALQRLIEELKELEGHPRNQAIKDVWSSAEADRMPRGRRIPRVSGPGETIPFTVELEPDMWNRIFNFSMKDFFTDAHCYLENVLRMMIYRFKEFQDFSPLDTTIPMWFAAVFESSLFGAEPVFKEDQCPWVAREPIIKSEADLLRLPLPDFYRSGLMPLMHRMYEELGELAGDDLDISLPQWFRSPFGLATHLHGLEHTLTDLILNPQFAHRLMRFLTDARKQWISERARFLGSPIEPGVLSNDEVNTPSLSPQLYEDFVLPYEQELCQFHGRIVYWHSCGNTSDLSASIAKIPIIDLFHIGPWTDLDKARKAMMPNTAFEKCLMPTTDVYFASPDDMAHQLDQIRNSLDGSSYTVRADAFQVVGNLEENLAKVKQWCTVAREKLCKETLPLI